MVLVVLNKNPTEFDHPRFARPLKVGRGVVGGAGGVGGVGGDLTESGKDDAALMVAANSDHVQNCSH